MATFVSSYLTRISMTEIYLTLAILIGSLVAFIAEWLPTDLTALAIAIFLMILGLVTPEEGISGFSNPATITVMAMFILSSGITKTGAIQLVRDNLVKWGGKTATRQIVLLGMIVGPISAFINNTAVVAVFLPIVEEWCRKSKISTSQLLIPLSYLSVLGGMITVLGTSTNILASGLSEKLGYGKFGLFEFTRIGLITFTIGSIYLAFIGRRFLPNRTNRNSQLLEQEYGLDDYVSEVIIPPRSDLIGQTLRQSGIQRKFDLDVLEIIHNDTHFPQPLADKILSLGDILIIRGGKEELLKIREERGVNILADVKFNQKQIESDLSTGEEKIAEVLILSNSRLIGTTLKDLRFRQRYNATVLAVRRGQEVIRQTLGKVKLRFGDLLLVQGPKESFIGLQTTRELLVLEERDVETLRQSKAFIAVGIVIGVILLEAFSIIPILVGSLLGIILMVVTGCMKPGEIYGAVRWDIIFLLAGLIPLGIAMKNTGTNEWIAQYIASVGGNLSHYWILFLFYLATSLITEVLSNNASVVLMLPVAAEVAKGLNLEPLPFMLTTMFAASNSFMTPIGYQTNTMVYSPGGYRFLDFTKVGAPLTIILTFVTPFLMLLFYKL